MDISVLLPVYNGQDHLFEAVESILKQSYKNFELICIDDGSTDGSLRILENFKKQDARVKVISRPNKGLVSTLNEGLSLARGRYIARMDADDVSEPDRLACQLELMKKNNLAVVGTSYTYIDSDGTVIGIRKLPVSDWLNKLLMNFGSPFCHPSILFDTQAVGENLKYVEFFKHCEDYELWFRCRDAGLKFGNCSQLLFRYRVLDGSVSRKHDKDQRSLSIQLLLDNCDFIYNEDEANYLLYERKNHFNPKYVFHFFKRNIVKFKFTQAFFVTLYLLIK